MAEQFDPYRTWLGISQADQPPHYYRLLGIALFEADPEVIEGSADRQMSHVQKYKTGRHSAVSQRLLNELAAAKLALLNPAKKAAYDLWLRGKLAAQAARQKVPAAAPVVVVQPAAIIVPTAVPVPRQPTVGNVLADGARHDYTSGERPTLRKTKPRQSPQKAKIPIALVLLPVGLLLAGIGGWLAFSGKPQAGLEKRPKAVAKASAKAPKQVDDSEDVATADPPTKKQTEESADDSRKERANDPPSVVPQPASSSSNPAANTNASSTAPSASSAGQDASLAPASGAGPFGPAPNDEFSISGLRESDSWIDIQTRLVQENAASGSWLVEKGSLRFQGPSEPGKFMLAYNPPPEFALEATFARQEKAEIGFGLTSGQNRFDLTIGGERGVALDLVDGKPGTSAAADVAAELLATKRQIVMTMIVRFTGLAVDCEGRRVLTINEAVEHLGKQVEFPQPSDRQLYLTGAGGPFRLYRLRLHGLGEDMLKRKKRKTAIATVAQADAPASDLAPTTDANVLVGAPVNASEASVTLPPSAGPPAEVPSEAAQQTATALIKDVFADDFAKAKKAADRAALAEKLLKQSRESRDPTEKYVLIVMARDLARHAGEPLMFFQAVELLGSAFAVNRCEMALAGAEVLARDNLSVNARQDLATGLTKVAERAVEGEQFDEARSLFTAAQIAARKANDPATAKAIAGRIADLGEMKKLALDVKAAEATLAKDPEDAAANLALGKIFCLLKDDWSLGLPLLSKSGDETFKTLAEQEIGDPKTAADRAKLADGWYALGEAATGKEKTNLLLHAETWYRRAQPELSGLTQVKVTKRLEEIAALHATNAGRQPTGTEKSVTSATAPATPTKSLSLRLKNAIKRENYTTTQLLAGGSSVSGNKFAEIPPGGGVLIGFHYSMDDKNNDQLTSLQAIYQVGKNTAEGNVWGKLRSTTGTIMAKKGYVVSGMTGRGNLNVASLELTFMKLDRGMLDSNDKYTSPWIGSKSNYGSPKTIGNDGQPVIGIIGSATSLVKSLGLVQLPAP